MAASNGYRRLALEALLPIWTERRLDTARMAARLQDAKGDHKAAITAQQRVESDLAHVAECDNPHCLICEVIAKNGTPAEQPAENGAAGVEDLDGWEEVRDPLALPAGEVIEAEAVEVG